MIPLITLEAGSELTSLMKTSGCQFNISHHQSSRGVALPNGTRFAPMNPVFILKGKFLGKVILVP